MVLARGLASAALGLSLLCTSLLCTSLEAQQANVNVPAVGVGHSFHENIGVSWGLRGNGWFFQWPGGGVAPQFGGFDPAAQGQLGGAFRGNGFSGFFGLTAGQGSNTFLGGSSSSVTVPNGGFGFVSDVSQRPFVLGLTPVVASPLEERLSRLQASGGLAPLRDGDETSPPVADDGSGATGGLPSRESTADHGDVSVAEIEAQQRARDSQQSAELESLLAKARSYEEAGKPGLARIYYQQALRRATGKQKSALEDKIRTLGELRSK